MSTPDQTFKVLAASASKERQSEIGTSFLSRPPSVSPSLPPSFPSLPSPPFPSPLRRRGSDTTNYSFPTKEEREGDVVNSYTAGSFAFFANFPRLVKKLSSSKPRASSGAPWPSRLLTPSGLGAEREGMGTCGWTSNLDLQGFRRGPHPGKCQSGAKSRDARPKSLGASRRGSGLGNLSQFRGPRGHKSGRHSATPVPKHRLCWGLGEGAGSAFPVVQLSPKQLPIRSSMARDSGCPGRSSTPAGGAARGGDSPPRAALGAGSPARAQRLRTAGAVLRLLREQGPLMVGAARLCAGWLRPR